MNENKKNIIATTARLIREKGCENVTVQDICREAFVARSTFYYQFKSIDDVIDQMFKYNYIMTQEHLDRLNACGSPLEKLFYFHRLNLASVLENGAELGKINISKKVRDGSPIGITYEYLYSTNFIVPYIRQCQKQGIIRNPAPAEKLAEVVTKTMIGCMIRWTRDGVSYDLTRDCLESLKCVYCIDDSVPIPGLEPAD